MSGTISLVPTCKRSSERSPKPIARPRPDPHLRRGYRQCLHARPASTPATPRALRRSRALAPATSLPPHPTVASEQVRKDTSPAPVGSLLSAISGCQAGVLSRVFRAATAQISDLPRHRLREFMVAQIMASIELGTLANPAIRLITWGEVLTQRKWISPLLRASASRRNAIAQRLRRRYVSRLVKTLICLIGWKWVDNRRSGPIMIGWK